MLRKLLLACACGAVACSDATGTAETVVASVAVTPPASTITVGAELPLQVVVQDASGQTITDTPVFWSVRDPAIASVSSSGVVTGLATGATQVAASAGGKSAIAAITVQRVPVASVVVLPSTAEATTGNRVQFSATVYDASQIALNDRTITWSSSNETVATVDSTGLATAVAAGVATITATSEVRSDAATITVTLVPVATVEVAPNPVAMSVGQSTQLSATARDLGGTALSGRTPVWSSSNTSAVTVTNQGVLNAVAPGTAIVTATIEGSSGLTNVTVTPAPVATVTVAPSTAAVFVQGTVPLSATLKDANGNTLTGRTVTWTTSVSAVATVSSSGGVNAIVTGVAPGTATITATSEGRSGTATVTVTLAPVAAVTVEPSTATVASGSTTTLTARVTDQNGGVLTNRVVTWSSSNPSVATVSGTGVVTAVVTGALVGTTTITASVEGKSGSATVTVTPGPITTVRVTPTSTSLPIGTRVDLTAEAFDAAGNPVSGVTFTWASSNPAIASVSVDGEVNAKKEGTVTISAITAGTSGSATVTVTK